MKNILSYLLLLSLFSLSAQDYIPFDLTDSTKWQDGSHEGYLGGSGTPGAGGFGVTSYSYLLDGDTLVDNKLYKRVYTREDWRYSQRYLPHPDFPSESITEITETNYNNPYVLMGGLRQDVDSQKVYFINFYEDEQLFNSRCFSSNPPPLNEEIILYDFSLTIGDSFGFDTVEAVGTITLDDGIPRRQLYFDNLFDDFWIEGIGGTLGLFTPFVSVGVESGCAGFCYNGISIPPQSFISPPSGLGEGCSSLIVSTKEISPEASTIIISPNPTSDIVQLETSAALLNKEVHFYAFNALGQLIFQQELSTRSTSLSLKKWPAGIYYFNFVVDQQQTISKRVMKQ